MRARKESRKSFQVHAGASAISPIKIAESILNQAKHDEDMLRDQLKVKSFQRDLEN